MDVGIFTLRRDSLTYTVAKALSFGGHSVLVWVADPRLDEQKSERCAEYLASTPRVRIGPNGRNEPPAKLDHLIVQGHRRLFEHRDTLDMLAARAPHITIISSGDRNRPWRQAMRNQWREILWYGRWLRKARRIVFKDGYYPLDLFSPSRARTIIGFDVHSQFLHDAHLFDRIHARDWTIDTPRPILANFLGSCDPAVRREILNSIRPLFVPGERSPIGARGTGKELFWHEYSDADRSVLSPERFIEILTDSDFTLCPTGYSLVTHRPLEALLRGSIPVLHASELDLYGIGLEDGKNCIGVARHGWAATIERIMAFSEEEIVQMRQRIDDMFAQQLDYERASAQIRAHLGVAAMN